MYLGGGFKQKKHRWNRRGKQAGRLRTGNANSGSILFFFVLVLVLVLDSSKYFFEDEGRERERGRFIRAILRLPSLAL
jgi:hypothetical protein